MAFSERSLDDYVDVAERIQEFYDRYPEGSLQPLDPASPWEQATCTGYDRDGHEITQAFIVYTAAAYRTPDDARPGVGIAWEVFPGRTNFTRGSEVMNAETSAWGRAIAALGIATKKGIASRQEVANRRHEREDGLPANRDGSLSRSRTTDEEKDAAGVMTAAQQAEHTGLGGGHPGERKTPAAERAKVTRIKPETPPDDPWADVAPVEAENNPGSIGPKQRRTIMQHLGKLSHTDRAARLTQITGRQVDTTNDLSFTEAQQVITELEAGK